MQVGHTRRAFTLYALGAGVPALASAATSRGDKQPWPARTPLPALSAPDLDGRTWDLASLRGKAVLLNFWASWCEPCRAEMPTLQELAEQRADKLTVLALNFKEHPAAAARFARNVGLKMPVLLDPDGEIAKRWGVKVFPTTVLIDPKGRPRWRVRGEMDWTSTEATRMVDALLG